jgi:hypothetical protein
MDDRIDALEQQVEGVLEREFVLFDLGGPGSPRSQASMASHDRYMGIWSTPSEGTIDGGHELSLQVFYGREIGFRARLATA